MIASNYLDISEKPFKKFHKVYQDRSESSNRQKLYHKYKLSKFLRDNPWIKMVGRGNVYRDTCGTVRRVFKCPDHDHIKIQRNSCGNLSCPVCYPSAIKKRIEIPIQKVTQYLAYEKSIILHHFSFHPLVDISSYEDITDVKKKILSDCKAVGLTGGVIITHPFRINKLTHQIECRLHFHIVGFAPNLLMTSDKFYEEYGYTYTQHKKRTLKDLERTISYLLGHSLYYYRKMSYSYFGMLSSRYCRVESKQSVIEIEKCPVGISENTTCDQQLKSVLFYSVSGKLNPLALSNIVSLLKYWRDFIEGKLLFPPKVPPTRDKILKQINQLKLLRIPRRIKIESSELDAEVLETKHLIMTYSFRGRGIGLEKEALPDEACSLSLEGNI